MTRPDSQQMSGMLNKLIQTTRADTNLISDGHHTIGELYQHRIVLWIALCKAEQQHNQATRPINEVWRTLRHSDGQPAFGGGWFVLGMTRPNGEQLSYHLEDSYWYQCEFAQTLSQAPPFDGHSPQDVLTRLAQLSSHFPLTSLRMEDLTWQERPSVYFTQHPEALKDPRSVDIFLTELGERRLTMKDKLTALVLIVSEITWLKSNRQDRG